MKKLLAVCLAAMLISAPLSACSCNKKSSKNSSSVTTSDGVKSEGYLQLNTYNITLFKGETYELQTTKYDINGAKAEIESISYTSDRALIASVENGVITAQGTGSTYVNVFADGLEVSCFVTVQEGTRGTQANIYFVEEHLYRGVPTQAYVYVTTDGAITGEAQNVTWSAADPEVLSVTADGKVTANAVSSGTTLKASFVYQGQEYNLEKTIAVHEPFYYEVSNRNLKLAALKTYSGADNTAYTQNSFTVSEVNLLTGERTQVTGDRMELSIKNESLVDYTVEQDGRVVVDSVSAGQTTFSISIKNTAHMVGVSVDVAVPLASIADMDKLSLASLVSSGDLSGSYMLVNDIDYEGKVFYPIANWRDKQTRVPGYIWKYLVDKTDTGYELVARENVGEAEYGLSEEEFKTFYDAYGINPNKVPFTGTLDGNGYAVKNAEIMLMANTLTWSSGAKTGVEAALIGYAKGATIKNIAFDNIGLYTPDDTLSYINPYAIDKVYDNNEWQENVLSKDATGKWKYHRTGMVLRAENTTFENVYLKMNYAGGIREQSQDGGLTMWGTGLTVKNCVVEADTNTADKYALNGTGDASSVYKNNLILGNINADFSILKNSLKTCGQDGNWWIKPATLGDWSAIFTATAGANAVNVIALETTIASFAANVWNTSALATGGAPTLNNGCSMLG